MADSSAEKTQEPTPKRLREAREKGQLARSRELGIFAGVASAVMVVGVMGSQLAQGAMHFLRDCLRIERDQVLNLQGIPREVSEAMQQGLLWSAPFLIATFIAAFAGPLLFGGWNFSTKALQPDFARLNPLSGIKRIFSANSLMELFKAVAKFVLLGGLAVTVLWTYHDRVMGLGRQDIGVAIASGLQLCYSTVALLCIGLAAIAAIDVPFQYHSHRKKLKMSLQEVKDEMKESEGRPEVKQHIRRVQQEMARKRMAQDIPTADVILNNPTHFSVALRYDQDSSRAPIVIAKGADHIAEVIQELGREHKVPQLRLPPLARALYRHVKVGEEVPAGLYLAVAQVLSYIFALNNHPQKAGAEPDPDIPDEFRWAPPKEEGGGFERNDRFH